MKAASAAAALATVLLAGCISVVPNLAPDTVPAGAPSSGGYGSQAWTVKVVDMADAPLPGAAVVAYWPSFSRGDTAEARRAAAPQELHYVGVRTDSTGVATFQAPSRYPVSVTAQASGTTEEWQFRRVAENGTQLVLRLYPKDVTVLLAGQWMPDARCNLQKFQFPTDHAEMQARMTSARLVLNWTNGAAEGIADLEPGVWLEPDVSLSGGPACPPPRQDAGQHLALGPQTETFEVDREVLGLDRDTPLGNRALYMGPVQRGAASQGLPATIPGRPYHLTVHAHLGLSDLLRGNATPEYGDALARPAPADAGDDPGGYFGEPTFETERDRTQDASAAIAPPLALLLVAGAAMRRRRMDR